ncbi:MAG: hypothetical protein K2X48_06765 [Chitinophagaceae bacterium]|nr:hypothetical protein [Chitinophagaceae bacterium]
MNRVHRLDVYFKAIAIVGLLPLCFHISGVFVKLDESSPVRHGAFILINLFCIVGLWKRPRWFIYFFILLTVQQLYSHGARIIRYFEEGRTDWISVALLMVLLTTVLLLFIERWDKSKH